METKRDSINRAALASANRYANLIRNKAKRDYAFAFIDYLLNGGYGNEPDRGKLSSMGAQAVRLTLNDMGLWA